MSSKKDKKQYNIVKLIYRTEKSIFNVVPIATIIMITTLMISAALAGVNTLYLSRLFNHAQRYLANGSLKHTIIIDAVLLITIFFLRKVLYAIFEGAMVRVDSKTMYSLQIELSEKCTRLPLYNYEDSNIVTELERAKNALFWTKITDLSLSFYNIFSEVLQVITVSFVLASFNIWLVPISLLSVIPYMIIRSIRGNMFYELKWFQAKSERKKNYLYNLFNNKQAVKEMRMMRTGDYLKRKWDVVRNNLNKETWDFKNKDALSLLLCDVIKTVGYLLSIVFVIIITLDGKMNIGAMSASLVAFLNFQTSAKYFLINLARIPECASFTSDFYQFMDLKEEKNGTENFDCKKDTIHLDNVTFQYPNTTEYAINDICLDIKPGEKIVIVGENGSGKTTLTKVILGLYDCKNGVVRYGNHTIHDIDKDKLYQNISVVSQNFTKYILSVRENITLNQHKSEEDAKIMSILKDLNLENILENEGIDTFLGKEFGGEELSQGQWQKLAIARALYRESDIVFLDEPTSALDPMIENEILTSFLNIARDKTAIIVSHRVGLCKLVDKIIVMKNGRIVECGNHDQLMHKQGYYSKMFHEQSKWYV